MHMILRYKGVLFLKERRGMFQFEIRVPKGVPSEEVGEVRDRTSFPRQGTLAEDQFY